MGLSLFIYIILEQYNVYSYKEISMKKTILKENCWGMLVPIEVDDKSPESIVDDSINPIPEDEEVLVTLEDIVLEITTSESRVLKNDIYDKYVIESEEDKKALNDAVKEMGWESYSSNGKTYWRKKEG